MYCLNEIGLAEYLYLDGDNIYSSKTNKYLKQCAEGRYRLYTLDRKQKNISLKEIYKELFDTVYCFDDIELLENEEFREIEGTNGNYEVSNYGRVKSKIGAKARILKPTITPKKYERLQIVIDGKIYNKFVHCLVASAWLDKPKNLEYEIHHKDFNSLNNNADNLQYISKIEHINIHNKRRLKDNAELQQQSKSETNDNEQSINE